MNCPGWYSRDFLKIKLLARLDSRITSSIFIITGSRCMGRPYQLFYRGAFVGLHPFLHLLAYLAKDLYPPGIDGSANAYGVGAAHEHLYGMTSGRYAPHPEDMDFYRLINIINTP